MAKNYTRISLKEREEIYKFHLEKKSLSEIAEITGRNKSSISRELTRCKDSDLGYIPDKAETQAKRCQQRHKQLLSNEKLLIFVTEKLREGWSPQQISGRLKLENNSLKISHETIYKFAYSKAGQALNWPKLLPRRQLKRQAKYGRKPKREIIPNAIPISARPVIIDGRSEIGHWEGDLVLFTCFKSNNITTLVERKSRFAKIVCNSGKLTARVIGGINIAIKSLPKNSVQSITFDRGTEFCSHENLKIKTYFCDPNSPWQKGGVENFNGRIRRFLPRSFDHKNLTQKFVDKIEDVMNNQPRKCLEFRTPAEVFYGTGIC